MFDVSGKTKGCFLWCISINEKNNKKERKTIDTILLKKKHHWTEIIFNIIPFFIL
jgi:hypothetical protein